jgi:hypothetical protein
MSINLGDNQGRESESSHRATVDCYLGLLHWFLAPFRWLRSLNFGEWIAVVLVAVAISATVWAK